MIRDKIETERYCLMLGDCRELTPTLPAGAVQVVATDPPYGINHPVNYKERGRGKLAGCRDYGKPVWNNPTSHNYPTIIGDKEPFDPAMILGLGVPTILWGANYYASRLPDASGWLVWDKERPDGLDQATCELAWTNCVKGVRRFKHLWNGMMRASEHGENYHPMQKPVALATWQLSLPWIPAGTVFDPYMGVGWVGVACVKMGRKFIGVEMEPSYFETAAERIAKASEEPLLFKIAREAEQGALFDPQP